jgi:hypothetical protein
MNRMPRLDNRVDEGATPDPRNASNAHPMIRFILRFLGLWFLAAAFVFLIYDGTVSMGEGAIRVTKTTALWDSIHQGSRDAVQTWANNIGVWDPVLRKVLDQPPWLVLGIVAALLIVAGRKKKPLIGYARR